MSRRCQRSNVSGVTIVATLRSTCRPSRVRPRAQVPSVIIGEAQAPPTQLPPQHAILFDQYATISRSWPSSQLVTVRSNMRRTETSITGRSYITAVIPASTTRSAETWDTTPSSSEAYRDKSSVRNCSRPRSISHQIGRSIWAPKSPRSTLREGVVVWSSYRVFSRAGFRRHRARTGGLFY